MKDALKIFASLFNPPEPESGGAVAISSLTGSADAFLAAALTNLQSAPKRLPRVVLAITPGLPEADRLTDDLRIVTADTPIRTMEFPPVASGDKSALGFRIKAMAALRAWSVNPYPCIVVAAFPALFVRKTKSQCSTVRLKLSSGDDACIGFGELVSKLAKMGYERLPQVEKEGDFSVRGGIVDFWGAGEEFPMRAEFFGEDMESLRTFNPATQISISKAAECEILPVKDEECDESANYDASLVEMLPEHSAVLALEHNEYGIMPLLAARPSLFTVFTGDPAPKGVAPFGFQTSPLPGFAELGADEAHHPELFDAAKKRLEQHIAAAERRGDVVVRLDDLTGGFETVSHGSKPPALLVVTKADRVFAKKRSHTRTNAAILHGPRLNDFDDIEPGEYVVHVDYGVGRYIGSSEIMVDGRRSEVFTIEYAEGAKLHVPAAHAHLLSRYVGVKGEAVKMHRLDGRRWAKDKQEAQKAVSDLAAALLETQARRETMPGFAYNVHCDGREAFDAAFQYEETEDQLAAIAAIDSDLASRKPMDRLICGDAGYGKTEVAMRAAFVAAMNGKQVAVLAPTTVLAEQHFETFTSRFDGTPVRIESVSRFQTSGTHAGTFKRIEAGICDIVIGTHAILSPKMRFHDLGLVIIDEEQRFGVAHKEFLKRLRATADVLTLSATPIPRTLYLSMTGARDLSLLRTPPRERVAVETVVVRDSDEVVKTAIESEIMRGGQVYFLHNRVLSIGKVERRIKSICPNARIVVAHGQMDARTLAGKMRDFERGKYDVLLSTTIVESGIDIPRANTILIDRADMFGMADLYQLRGRVGRSARQGYAYFLLPESGAVDSDARERLAAIKRHGGLGAGFNLAVRDLELRGAGNLLGTQQSGHIAAVGFGLYCQLLQRTIAMMRGEKVKDIVDVKLNLDFANPRIPFTYVEEDVLRLSLMKRFAEAQDAKTVNSLAREMADRFGPPPPEAEEYVRIARLRTACAAAGITNIDVRNTQAVFYRTGSRDIDFVETLRGKTAAAKIAELGRIVARRTTA